MGNTNHSPNEKKNTSFENPKLEPLEMIKHNNINNWNLVSKLMVLIHVVGLNSFEPVMFQCVFLPWTIFQQSYSCEQSMASPRYGCSMDLRENLHSKPRETMGFFPIPYAFPMVLVYKNLHDWVILGKGKCWCAYSSTLLRIWAMEI